jgi:hypothetical protein
VLSRFPIDTGAVRTFQRFLWKDLPGARLPEGFYSPEELAVLPLASKSHWDVPVHIGDRTLIASGAMPVASAGALRQQGLVQALVQLCRRFEDIASACLAQLAGGETATAQPVGRYPEPGTCVEVPHRVPDQHR